MYNTFSVSPFVSFFYEFLSCEGVVLQIETIVNMGFHIVIWTDEAHVFKKKKHLRLINITVYEQDAKMPVWVVFFSPSNVHDCVILFLSGKVIQKRKTVVIALTPSI